MALASATALAAGMGVATLSVLLDSSIWSKGKRDTYLRDAKAIRPIASVDLNMLIRGMLTDLKV